MAIHIKIPFELMYSIKFFPDYHSKVSEDCLFTTILPMSFHV